MEDKTPLKRVSEKSVLASSMSDQTAQIDSLTFGAYVAAIAEFLTNEAAKGPFYHLQIQKYNPLTWYLREAL